MSKTNTTTLDFSIQPIPNNRNFKDLTGKQFGRLVVIGFHRMDAQRDSFYVCQCVCGVKKVILRKSLLNGDTKSCGCYQKDNIQIYHTKHQESRCGKNPSYEYRTYLSAKSRCGNTKSKRFADYGGRGIKFLFTSYEEFLNTLGRRPSKQYSLDRIDNNGHYSPENCRWATRSEQQNNRRVNRLLTINGETKTLPQWQQITGLQVSVFRRRIKSGWCEACIILPSHCVVCIHKS